MNRDYSRSGLEFKIKSIFPRILNIQIVEKRIAWDELFVQYFNPSQPHFQENSRFKKLVYIKMVQSVVTHHESSDNLKYYFKMLISIFNEFEMLPNSIFGKTGRLVKFENRKIFFVANEAFNDQLVKILEEYEHSMKEIETCT